ncbi:MAG: FG-GAP-like repeat-containing protein [Bacteroidota bacterium]
MKFFPTLICLVFTVTNILAQSPQVIAKSPAGQSMLTSPGDPIIITFDQPIDEATVNANTFHVFGRWSGPMDGIISFESGSTVVKFTPVRDFFYGEWVRVGLSNGIENQSGMPLTHGFNFGFWTKSLPASLDLIYGGQIDMRQSGEGPITCYGAYAGDVNNDEFSDLVVVTEDSDDIRILLSDGDMNYEPFVITEMPPDQGPSTNEGADFNRDGLIDMAIGSTYANTINVLMGDPVTHFGDQTTYVSDEGVRGLTVGDFNGDGWDDIATANRFASNISLFFNDGTGSFEPAVYIDSGFAGETSIVATDLNDDGYIDLIVAAYSSNRVISLLNDGTGNFAVEDWAIVGERPWMLAIGDLNGDGFVDVATANQITDDVSIVMSDGTGGLDIDAHYPTNKFTVAIDLGDIDGDGDLDFISSNVLGGDYTLMENDGSGNFINPRVYPSADMSACAIIHDRNNDGAMDITMIDEADDLVILYNNTLNLGTEDAPANTDLTLYPNPFSDRIFVSGTIIGPVRLELFDVNGRLLFAKDMENSNHFDLNETALSEGLYITKLIHNGSSQNFKLYKNSKN